jgi:hypothetical protein
VALADEVGDRTQDVRCAGCHEYIDPIGRVFASLDPDNEQAPPPAEVLGTEGLAGSYANAAELLEAVGNSRAYAECFARHWLGFFLEQPLESADASWVASIADAVEGGASLGAIVEQSLVELHARSQPLVPWCEGE